jgi:NADPH-dependent curcumin reductase CurA
VVGSVGGPVKSALIKEKYGFEAIDYKTVSTAPELIALLKGVAPDGIDMYFENVGGIHFEAAMDQLRPKGRVAVCGMISDYHTSADIKCSFNPMKMIYTAQRIEGFVCFPWLDGSKGHFLTDMSDWLKEGVVQVDETFFEGIEQWPNAFQALFTGANVGKVVVRVA